MRNDIRPDMNAEYNMDALEFCRCWQGKRFFRKSMEMYDGKIMSPFNALKNSIERIITNNGIVITFGYHSVSMGKIRNFKTEAILLISHGGAIHDTIATIERKMEIFSSKQKNIFFK